MLQPRSAAVEQANQIFLAACRRLVDSLLQHDPDKLRQHIESKYPDLVAPIIGVVLAQRQVAQAEEALKNGRIIRGL